MKLLLSGVVGYLIGSASFSVILSRRIFHQDVRTMGSGNAGATNVARSFGWLPGLAVFAADLLKCLLALWLGKRLGGAWGQTAAGIGCVIGHCYPLYYKFRGGKAVTTGTAIALMLGWRLFLPLFGVFLVLVLLTRYVSLGSVCASLALIAAALLIPLPKSELVLALFVGCAVILRHRENIDRLLHGRETKFKAGKTQR